MRSLILLFNDMVRIWHFFKDVKAIYHQIDHKLKKCMSQIRCAFKMHRLRVGLDTLLVTRVTWI